MVGLSSSLVVPAIPSPSKERDWNPRLTDRASNPWNMEISRENTKRREKRMSDFASSIGQQKVIAELKEKKIVLFELSKLSKKGTGKNCILLYSGKDKNQRVYEFIRLFLRQIFLAVLIDGLETNARL